MSADATVRVITDLFFRRPADRAGVLPATGPRSTSAAETEHLIQTRALRKFLSCVASNDSPVLLDLGPIVGPNVSFFGDRLGCKFLVENLFADLERYTRTPGAGPLPAVLASRFAANADESVDGVLCWDLFDFLDIASAKLVGKELVRMLRPGGAILGFFGTTKTTELQFAKYQIVDDHQMQRRTYAATRERQAVLLNREVIRLFDGTMVSDSYLLKSNTREILFRKAPRSASGRTT